MANCAQETTPKTDIGFLLGVYFPFFLSSSVTQPKCASRSHYLCGYRWLLTFSPSTASFLPSLSLSTLQLGPVRAARCGALRAI